MTFAMPAAGGASHPQWLRRERLSVG
jgi:hypothetical protein